MFQNIDYVQMYIIFFKKSQNLCNTQLYDYHVHCGFFLMYQWLVVLKNN